MEYREYTGKTVEDAVMEAAIQLETSSDKLEYEVLDKGSSGFLGIGSRPAKIRACKVLDRKGIVEEFLKQVFGAMNMVVQITIEEDQEENPRKGRYRKLPPEKKRYFGKPCEKYCL